ncbi:MAG: copper resistance protein CopC [Dehalococcoidia bacterium]|nr:copper resistance protein CopC [Dehalococcoidia bacterium]
MAMLYMLRARLRLSLLAGLPAMLVVAGALVLLLAVSPRTVEAHAALVTSEPAANAVLDASPGRVHAVFTEPMVAAASVMEVLDASGEQVDLGDTRLDEGNANAMSVSLPDGLPDGTYTVAWRNLSDVDGHVLRGAFVFFIGEPDFSAVGAMDEAPLLASPFEPLLRWGVLLGGMLLAGVPATFALVLRAATPVDLRPMLRRRLDVVALVGGVVLLVAGYAQLGVQWQNTELPLADLLVDTTWGRAWILRSMAASVAAMAFVVCLADVPAAQRRIARRVAVTAGVAAVAASSLSSHAAATPESALGPVAVQVVHLLAAAAWGGGLVAFLVLLAALRGRSDFIATLRTAMPRFSTLGILATVALALSGTYASWLHLVTADAIATPYGAGVVVKVALLLVLLMVAAVNLLWVSGRLRNHDHRGLNAAAWLRRTMRAEVALIVLAVGAGATIASLEPGRQSVTRAGEQAQSSSTEAGLEIHAALEPGTLGENRVVVDLERRGDAYEGATAVVATLTTVEPALGDTEVTLRDAGGGRWQSDPFTVSVAGEYQLAVLVQRSDGFDARHSFRFATGTTPVAEEVSPSTAGRVAALVLVLVGVAMVAANVVTARRRVVRGEGLGWVGMAVFATGLWVFTSAPGAPPIAGNPVPSSTESVEAGRALYQQHCAVCHGVGGWGDGPQAASLEYPPLNLVEHVPFHPDEELYSMITDGILSRGMPAWADTLTDEERWYLVNFLRVLAREGAFAPHPLAPR